MNSRPAIIIEKRVAGVDQPVSLGLFYSLRLYNFKFSSKRSGVDSLLFIGHVQNGSHIPPATTTAAAARPLTGQKIKDELSFSLLFLSIVFFPQKSLSLAKVGHDNRQNLQRRPFFHSPTTTTTRRKKAKNNTHLIVYCVCVPLLLWLGCDFPWSLFITGPAANVSVVCPEESLTISKQTLHL